MKIKIIKCKDDNFWYKNLIGEIIKPINEDQLSYQIETTGLRYNDILTTGWILKEDCEIIKE